ncbi:hypothetical protein [Paractinoplanes ovalisporus]|uniref:hypothetical protein n=1 Tax=Paractinoplanes ovalisporus TaxID=2810368 RepID=UPI001F2CF145|nr:hypothetical protein [Actinoplanes ovalisporus]
MLEAGGVFACFGGPVDLADPAVDEAVRAVRAPFLESDDVTLPGQTDQWPGPELRESERFTDVRQAVIERRWAVSADYYVGHLSTISAYLELPVEQQEQLYDAILRVVPETVELTADVVVHLARVSR